MSHSSKQSNKVLDKGSQFINDNPNIIKQIFKDTSYNDDPKLYMYGIFFKDKYEKRESEDATAAGVSFYKEKALAKVLGETIERYSLGSNNNKKFISKSYAELIAKEKLTLDPNSLFMYSKSQHNPQDFHKQKLHWIEGKSLVSKKNCFIPGQLVYVPYVFHSSEPMLRFPISTGAAASSSLEDAIYRGICEIVERDSFVISYLNKMPSPIVDLNHLLDNDLKKITQSLKRYKLELYVIDTTTDLEIPSFAAILLDRTGLGPSVSVGLKAGFNIKEAIVGAIEEALMVRAWSRDKFIFLDPNYKRGKEIISIEDRAHFWLSTERIKDLEFWIRSKNRKKLTAKDMRTPSNKFGRALELLKKSNIETFYVDITDDKVRKYGFVVVKVVIPQLQPLYLNEKHPYWGGNRLYNVPVKMGVFKNKKSEAQLNKIPHPFL